MKLKLNQINPNPFKKEINKGKLDKEQIAKLKSNIKELGLMGSIPVVKIGNKYHCVSHHHRLQALKEVYGNNYQIEVVVHKYNDDQLLRGMVIENLTQRAGDFKEEIENLVAIRNYLKKQEMGVQTLDSHKDSIGRKKSPQQIQEAGSVRHIEAWLNKHGEVMSRGKIDEWLRVADSLDKDILDEVSWNVGHTHQTEGKISVEDAKNISRIEDKEQQKAIKDIIVEVMASENPMNYKQKSEAITNFKKASEEIKKKVIEKKIEITDIPMAVHKAEVGKVDLSREKLSLEESWKFQESLKKLFEEKMFLKRLPASELEVLYHYLLNCIRKDLIPFMRAIEEEFKLRGKDRTITYYDLTKREN